MTRTRTQTLALTHAVSARMNDCVRTHAELSIDVALMRRQHEAYREALARAGAEVMLLDVNPEAPDAVFIEDTAIILAEVAILTSMGTPSRVGEPAGVEPVLARHRPIMRILPPATIEGGDVLCVGKRLLVGVTSRTSESGLSALAGVVRPYGYTVTAVPVTGCLHLKTACTALPDGSLLSNPRWLTPAAEEALEDFEHVRVPEDEAHAANVVVIDEDVVMSDGFPRTAALVRQHAARVHVVDLTEFAKADGSATCLSLLFAMQ